MKLTIKVRSSKILDASKQMKKDIYFLLKRIEWCNSWLRATEVLSALFLCARARTECIGHVCAPKLASEGFHCVPAQHAQPSLGWGSGWSGWWLAVLMDGPLPSMALPWLPPSLCPCHTGQGSEASGALGSLCMKTYREMKESTRGFLFHFVLMNDYFLYLVAFKRGLWLNHRSWSFSKCLPFVE